MAKDKSAVESFLGDVEENKTFEDVIDPFEVPLEPQEEDKKEDKPLPFHKDPKIQKYLDKREQEIEERLKSKISEVTHVTQTEDEFKEVIDSLTAVVGNDTAEKVAVLNSFKKALVNLDEKSLRRAEEKIQEIRDKERQEEDEAEEELTNALENIEENYDVDLTSAKATNIRKEFVTFVEKIAPKDRNGEIIDYPDMNSAWETFSEIRTAQKPPSRAKELASQSMARSASTTTQKQERVDWNKVDEFMDTLKN